MKLFRPYVPLKVRVAVAARQLRECKPNLAPSILYGLDDPSLSDGRRLDVLLRALFSLVTGGMMKFELHHRPALVNRRKRTLADGSVTYTPPANDPAHLVYLAADDHDIETRVRGQGAQRSDFGQRRYNKRVAKNRTKRSLKVTAVKSGRLAVGDTVTWPGAVGKIRFIVSATSKTRANDRNPKRKWASRPLQSRGFR